MSGSTNYDINLRYRLNDMVTRGLNGMGGAADRAASKFGGLKTAIAGYFGGRAAYGALVKYNDTIEQTKIQIAGMTSMAKQSAFADELKATDAIYKSISKQAAALPGTTQEYATMLGMIAQPVTDAKLGTKDLIDLTVGATVAARAMRVEADAGARDIGQALRGQFNSRDMLTGPVLGSIGYKGESGREAYNQLSAAKRASELKRALGQQQIKDMAAAQGNTYGGILSTAQDTAQRFFGKVGAPMFEILKKEMKRINAWVDTHEKQIEKFANRLADALVTGFGYVKDVIGFIVDHRDTIMMLGKVWLAAKAGGALGGMIPGMGDKGGSVGTVLGLSFYAGAKLREGIDNFFGNGTKVPELNAQAKAIRGGADSYSSLGSVQNSMGVGYDMLVGGNATKMQMLRQQLGGIDSAIALSGGDIRKKAGLNNATDAVFQQQRNSKLEELAKTEENLLYYLNEIRNKQTLTFGQSLDVFNVGVDQLLHSTNMARDAFALVSKDVPALFNSLWDSVSTPFLTMFGITGGDKKKEAVVKKNTNITINRIEVQSNDPDLFAFGMEELARKSAGGRSARLERYP